MVGACVHWCVRVCVCVWGGGGCAVRVRVHVCGCVCAWMCAWMCVCVCAHVCTHAHVSHLSSRHTLCTAEFGMRARDRLEATRGCVTILPHTHMCTRTLTRTQVLETHDRQRCTHKHTDSTKHGHAERSTRTTITNTLMSHIHTATHASRFVNPRHSPARPAVHANHKLRART